MATTVLNAKGLNCPLPVLRALKAAKELLPGDFLEVLTTDSSCRIDFEAFCEATGHRMMECRENGGVFTIVIRIAG